MDALVHGEFERNERVEYFGEQFDGFAFVGQSFWVRGYFVSKVGRDEQVIRTYIRNQEAEDRRLEQLQSLR